MMGDSAALPFEEAGSEKTLQQPLERVGPRSAFLAVAVGGLIAGTLDLLQACILFGWDIPFSIAGGVLGPKAESGGVGTYVLGVCLHFLIAFSAAAVYLGVSRSLRFLTEHPLVCGLFFGMAVELVMRLVVLPLSALHDAGLTNGTTCCKGCWCTWWWSGCRSPSACGGSRGKVQARCFS